MKSLKASLFTLLSFVCACSGQTESSVLIINGKQSDVKKLPATLFFSTITMRGTGTVLTDTKGAPGETTIILTAAHMVVDLLGPGVDQKVFAPGSAPLDYSRETLSFNGLSKAEIVSITIPKTFAKLANGDSDEGVQRAGGFDVALIVVRGLAAGMTGAKIDYDNPVKEGERAILSGYGCEKLAESPGARNSGGGILRQSLVQINSVWENNISLYIGDNEDQGILCPGDSGGAMFAENDTILVRGINSSGNAVDSNITPIHRGSDAGQWLLTTLPTINNLSAPAPLPTIIEKTCVVVDPDGHTNLRNSQNSIIASVFKSQVLKINSSMDAAVRKDVIFDGWISTSNTSCGAASTCPVSVVVDDKDPSSSTGVMGTNVRLSENIGSSLKGVLKNGTTVKVLEKKGNRIRVAVEGTVGELQCK